MQNRRGSKDPLFFVAKFIFGLSKKRGDFVSDILFKKDGFVFSYRVAGIAVHDGKVLLQKPTNEDFYAFPGGHVEFGETNEETLIQLWSFSGLSSTIITPSFVSTISDSFTFPLSNAANNETVRIKLED